MLHHRDFVIFVICSSYKNKHDDLWPGGQTNSRAFPNKAKTTIRCVSDIAPGRIFFLG
jgi:hypothetical protein